MSTRTIANYPAKVYIDGPDAAGKSTLTSIYTNYYNCDFRHLDASDPNDYEFHHMLISKPEMAVFDRFMISEVVYSTIYKRPCKLNMDELYTLWNQIMLSDSLYIILYTSDMSILEDRLKERGELDYLAEINQQNNLFKYWGTMLNSWGYKNFHLLDIADQDFNNKINVIFNDFYTWRAK
jgi:thymidylate kinase